MPSFQRTGKTNFIRNDDNKDKSVFHRTQETGHHIHHIGYCSRYGQNTVGLQSCSHEEADTRMPIHVKYPMNCGLKTVPIRTVGTYVVVLAVANFQGLPNIQQLWIAFGTGKEFKYIPIHKIASTICPQFAKGLLFFHTFTGCDVTSYFTNRGKKSAWKTGLNGQI